MKITGFTVWLVPQDAEPNFSWRKGIPGSHGDRPNGYTSKSAIIRLETDSGLFGAIQVKNGVAALDLVERRYHEFIGDDVLLTERLWQKMW